MLDGRYRFETMVVGASNRLAVSAAHAVSRAPGEVYNPLFILGAPGMGKTHLLAALGHAACALRPDLAAAFLTLEEFLAELHEAEAAGNADACRARYEELGLLLLDDVRLFNTPPETQVELLRLLTTLQKRGGQVVMAGDQAPIAIPGLDPRLLTRIAAGLIVDIGQPEYETRLAILRGNAATRNLVFPPGTLEQLARENTRNVRELRTAFNRLVPQPPPPPPNGVAAEPAGHASRTPTASNGHGAIAPDEFQSFLTEIASAVSQSVEPWRAQLGEAITRWAREGYRTGMLERHLQGEGAADVRAAEAAFIAAVDRLRILEGEAARLDPKLATLEPFHDPERLEEAETVVRRALAAYDPAPAPHAHFSLENFVAGARNQVALRSASEVIALPGSRYNPLYLYGPSEAGKTHLAHAIGNALAARERGAWSIACVNAAAFADELVDALQDGTLERWRLRYGAADVFIIDDVHSLAGCEAAQEELVRLLQALQPASRQIVVASRRPPGELQGLMPALVTLFESGLAVEIGYVPHAERVARYTPVPAGAEAAAPTIDATFEGVEEPATPASVGLTALRGKVDTFFLDPEKVVIEWPGLDGRVIEDYR